MEREIIEEGLTLKLVKESENYVRYKVTDKYEYEAYYLDIWNDYEEYDEDECDRDDKGGCGVSMANMGIVAGKRSISQQTTQSKRYMMPFPISSLSARI